MGLYQILTDPSSFKFYAEKNFINPNAVSTPNSFGQKSIGYGDGNQPYIKIPIPGSGVTFNQLNQLSNATNPYDFSLIPGFEAISTAKSEIRYSPSSWGLDFLNRGNAFGLVISTEQFNDVKMRHMGYTFEELQTQIRAMVEQLPLTVESMNKMKAVELDEKSIVEFAEKALATRFKAEELQNIKVDLDKLLEPTRPEDKGNDLWSVFNVLQEKILEGDFQYMTGTKIRKARKVKNFKQDIEINQKLFANPGPP